MADSDCLFCKIARGDMPADKVYEDTHAVVFKDINPQAPIHLLAIPRAHYPSIQDIPDDDMGMLNGLFAAIKHVIAAEGLAHDGYRLVINSGEKSGQAVFHLHVHILAGRAMQWPPG